MRAKSATSTLKALCLTYLASATAFGVAIVLHSNPQWPEASRVIVRLVTPYATETAELANEKAVKPSIAWAMREDKKFFDWITNRPAPVAPVVRTGRAPVQPVLRPTVVSKPSKPAAAPPVVASLPSPRTPLPALVPAPEANPLSPEELARVTSHFKLSLNKELYENFELFLYISKAERGPWAQRMYVLSKKTGGDLKLIYNWPASTGRETVELAPGGTEESTATPAGYYEFDPDRMYLRYHSIQWDQPMPYAMFFNWEKDGNQTGLAIHGAVGDSIVLLGKRSSAGCVRINPQNARLLYRLIRDYYKGPAPRFAYDRRTATMSKDGMLMRDKDGNLKFEEGYKVLVFIENNGGENVVAALF
jgi:hypothetical protein